jgi:hypothetical protein
LNRAGIAIDSAISARPLKAEWTHGLDKKTIALSAYLQRKGGGFDLPFALPETQWG